jgi:hypothetical protein
LKFPELVAIWRGTIAAARHYFSGKRQTRCSMVSDHAKRRGVRPVWAALLVAIFGILAMLLVDHGPWTRPHAQSAEAAHYHTTGEAARAVGADVAPTAPKSELEPDPLGPKREAPPNPEQE